jgi:hypothetical protein
LQQEQKIAGTRLVFVTMVLCLIKFLDLHFITFNQVWDTEGRLLYSCPSQGAPVTSLAWSWDGALLAVGAHNSLRLSLATGVSKDMYL